MRNAFLTKTLLCGVMATTFFLINCQKAPSRGVKAQTAPVGTDSIDKAGTQAKELVVECSPTFLTKYTESSKLVDELSKANTTDLDEAQKEELRSKEKIAREKTNAAVAEMLAINPNATACKTKDGKSVYQKANILGSLDKVNLTFAQKGIETEGLAEAKKRQEEALAKKAQREAQRAVKGLTEGMSFVVSDDLAEVLKSENVGAVYFKAGQIVKNPSDESKKKDLADTKLTMCELGSGTSDYEKGTEAKVTSIEAATAAKDAKSNRYKLTVVLTAGSAIVNFDCVIADGKQTVSGEEFRNVFAKNLLTKENIDAAKKKAMTVDEAKAIVAKKQEGVDAATKAVENAEAAVKAKETEISAMSGDKTTATADKDKLVAKVEQLKKDLETAKKQKADADAALKKLEDAAAAKA